MKVLRVWAPSWAATTRAPAGPLPFPLEEPGVRLYAQARGALRDCVPSIGLRPGDEVLVPSYHHGSEVQALLDAGQHCRMYEPAPDLQPDERELDALIGPSTRALHLIHYLGFPQDAARWRRWCDSRGLLLVEDAAQAWLAVRDGLPVGTHGDLAVFCLYKSVGLPDGAAVRGQVALPSPGRRGASGLSFLVKPVARELLTVVGDPRRQAVFDQVRDVAVPPRSRAESALTRHLLGRSEAALAAGRRRAGYAVLLDELRAFVPAPFDVLPPGASPFAFPIAVRDKVTALAVLEAGGVQASDLWRLPHPALPARPRGTAAWLRRHLVGLPVHQGLSAADLARMVRVARAVEPARHSESVS